MESNKWYCKLPWTGFSNDPDGKTRPCCLFKGHIEDDLGNPMYVQKNTVNEIFTSQYMKNLREEFRKGNKPIGCNTCIVDEQNNYTSKRQRYLNDYDDNVDYDCEPEFPVEYQMILSNACNLKCRSCTPSHSSLWQAEHKILWGHTGYNMPEGQSGENNSLLWTDRHNWMKFVKRLEIVGGEPFYISRWKILWDEFIDQNLSKDVVMDMSSNCNIYSGETVEKLVKNFKKIGLGLSIDGLGKTYEYLRHTGKWSEVEKNILKYHKLRYDLGGEKFDVSISHTIGWLNAWELPEFHSYILKNTPLFSVWNNIIHYPTHMSIYMIPKNFKRAIEDKWKKYDWGIYKKDVDAIITYMNSKQPSDEEIREQYKVFLRHDKLRNENILDTVPLEVLPYVKNFFVE